MAKIDIVLRVCQIHGLSLVRDTVQQWGQCQAHTITLARKRNRRTESRYYARIAFYLAIVLLFSPKDVSFRLQVATTKTDEEIHVWS